jgi:NTP pyrophosphatase (non-canonical NTP hydrolase)
MVSRAEWQQQFDRNKFLEKGLGKFLEKDTITTLQREVIDSQMKHGETAMLNIPVERETLAYRLSILIEEVGEVGKAICEQQGDEAVEAELFQVGAMALSWAEASRKRRELNEATSRLKADD